MLKIIVKFSSAEKSYINVDFYTRGISFIPFSPQITIHFLYSNGCLLKGIQVKNIEGAHYQLVSCCQIPMAKLGLIRIYDPVGCIEAAAVKLKSPLYISI